MVTHLPFLACTFLFQSVVRLPLVSAASSNGVRDTGCSLPHTHVPGTHGETAILHFTWQPLCQLCKRDSDNGSLNHPHGTLTQNSHIQQGWNGSQETRSCAWLHVFSIFDNIINRRRRLKTFLGARWHTGKRLLTSRVNTTKKPLLFCIFTQFSLLELHHGTVGAYLKSSFGLGWHKNHTGKYSDSSVISQLQMVKHSGRPSQPGKRSRPDGIRKPEITWAPDMW